MTQTYRDLLVWQAGMSLVEESYQLTQAFPKGRAVWPYVSNTPHCNFNPCKHCRGSWARDATSFHSIFADRSRVGERIGDSFAHLRQDRNGTKNRGRSSDAKMRRDRQDAEGPHSIYRENQVIGYQQSTTNYQLAGGDNG